MANHNATLKAAHHEFTEQKIKKDELIYELRDSVKQQRAKAEELREDLSLSKEKASNSEAQYQTKLLELKNLVVLKQRLEV